VSTEKTLEDLLPGQRGTIIHVSNKSAAVKRRLVDMGLTPGTEVFVKKIAPFGDPIELSVRGYDLSIRKDDAKMIKMGEKTQRAAKNRYLSRMIPVRSIRRRCAACGATMSMKWKSTPYHTTPAPTTRGKRCA
jgi:ferrous iron transport protein B